MEIACHSKGKTCPEFTTWKSKLKEKGGDPGYKENAELEGSWDPENVFPPLSCNMDNRKKFRDPKDFLCDECPFLAASRNDLIGHKVGKQGGQTFVMKIHTQPRIEVATFG